MRNASSVVGPSRASRDSPFRSRLLAPAGPVAERTGHTVGGVCCRSLLPASSPARAPAQDHMQRRTAASQAALAVPHRRQTRPEV